MSSVKCTAPTHCRLQDHRLRHPLLLTDSDDSQSTWLTNSMDSKITVIDEGGGSGRFVGDLVQRSDRGSTLRRSCRMPQPHKGEAACMRIGMRAHTSPVSTVQPTFFRSFSPPPPYRPLIKGCQGCLLLIPETMGDSLKVVCSQLEWSRPGSQNGPGLRHI
jgi:hypothetical protein